MNESWKEKLKKKWEITKEDATSARKIKMLGLCVGTMFIYSIIAALNISGIIGLVLRGGCFGVMLGVLLISIK